MRKETNGPACAFAQAGPFLPRSGRVLCGGAPLPLHPHVPPPETEDGRTAAEIFFDWLTDKTKALGKTSERFLLVAANRFELLTLRV